MDRTNETLSYMIYMANSWCPEEAAIVFNGKENYDTYNWEYSLGWHIWNKYRSFCEDFNMYAAYSLLIFELDDDNREKLLNRACELYNGRDKRSKL